MIPPVDPTGHGGTARAHCGGRRGARRAAAHAGGRRAAGRRRAIGRRPGDRRRPRRYALPYIDRFTDVTRPQVLTQVESLKTAIVSLLHRIRTAAKICTCV